MLPVNCGSHTDYQHFVVTNLRKYYPDPDALALAGDGTPVVERSSLLIMLLGTKAPDFNAVSPNYFTVINESEKLSISFFRLVTVKRYVPGTEGALIPSPSAIV